MNSFFGDSVKKKEDVLHQEKERLEEIRCRAAFENRTTPLTLNGESYDTGLHNIDARGRQILCTIIAKFTICSSKDGISIRTDGTFYLEDLIKIYHHAPNEFTIGHIHD